MADGAPVTELAYQTGETAPTHWGAAAERLAQGGTFWLATVRADGRPHVTPLLAVWHGGAVHFTTSHASRKARNLATDPNCVICTGGDDMDVVVEGRAGRVTDDERLRGVAAAYLATYGWEVTVADGLFHTDNGIGEPPYQVYAVTPSVGFGFGKEAGFSATRWRF